MSLFVKIESLTTLGYFVAALVLAVIYYIVPNMALPWIGLIMLLAFASKFFNQHKNIDPLFYLVAVLLIVSALSMGQVIVGIANEIYPGGNRYIPNNTYTQNKTFYIISLSIFCLIPFLSDKNYEFYRGRACADKITIYILMLFILVASILANPVTTLFSASYGSDDYGGEVYGSGLIGGWRSIVIVLYAIYAVKTRLKSRRDLVFTILLMGYWLIHGSRAEIIGVAFCYFSMNYKQVSSRGRVVLAIFGVIVVSVFQIIGDIRGLVSIGVDELLKLAWENKVFFSEGALYISTIDPINYSLLSLVYALDHGVVRYAYLDYFGSFLTRTLPGTWDIGIERAVDLAVILDETMYAKGGTHFVGEAYYSLGSVGVIFYAFGVFILLSHVRRVQVNSELNSVFYLSLLMLAFRYVWYGSIYLYKIVILFLVLNAAAFILKAVRAK